MSVKAVTAKKSIGVQCDETLESKTGDIILLNLTLKQVKMIVQKTVKEVLKHNKVHIDIPTLDASQIQSVEKILEKKRNQNLHGTRSDDNKSVPMYISFEVQESTSQSPVVLANDDYLFKDSSSATIISKIGPSHDEIPPSKECIITVPCTTSSIHIMPGENALQSKGPSIYERVVPSPHPTENCQILDKSLPKCTSSMESKIIQLPSWNAHGHTEIITSHASTEGIVNVPSTIGSIHISEDDLLPNGSSICESIFQSLTPAVNGPTLDNSLPMCTFSMDSKNVPLPSWNAQRHDKMITSTASTEGIVNVPSTISSIHIMLSECDLPSCRPSLCEKIVPSLTPVGNGQALDKSLSNCTSPRKSLNVPLPSWNVHSNNRRNTSPPPRKGIVNVPSTISSIHIMPSEDDLLSIVPSTISSIHIIPSKDDLLSIVPSTTSSTHIMPSEDDLLSIVPSTISSIPIIPSEDDLPAYVQSVCERIITSLTAAVNGPTLDKSLMRCTSSMNSHNVPLLSWHTHGHYQEIISNCTMNQTLSGVRPSLLSLFQSERVHQNGTHNYTHWYVIKKYL